MTNMTNLQRLLRPKSIAVVGGAFANEVVRQLKKIGYDGDVWPVSPKRPEMHGIPSYKTVDALPSAPDAAFIGVPRGATVEIVRQLAELGAGGAVCYASGFAEVEDGQEYHAGLQAAMGEMAIVGPNCYGVLNYLDGVTLWPDENGGSRLEKGVGIIAQSGNIGISFTMQQRSVPVAYVISTGNQAGATIPDYIEAMLLDERVTAIGIHVEGLDDVAAFSRAAVHALEKKVPIVVIKSGASELGSHVAMSHTSSLAGSDALYDALFARLGVVRAYTIPQFLETLKFLSIVGPVPAPTVASISCSGGEAALTADRAAANGLSMPPLTEPQSAELFDILGEKVALGNPLDYHTYIWDNEPAQTNCFAGMLRGEQAVTLKILDFPRPDICDPAAWVKAARAFSTAVDQTGAQGVVVSTLQENMLPSMGDLLIPHGVAPMHGLEDCLIAIKGAHEVYLRQSGGAVLPLAEPKSSDGNIQTLDEAASKKLIAEFGIAVLVSAEATVETAPQVAAEIGFPVVVKVLSAEIVHKSDVGGVALNLNSEDEVAAAVGRMSSLSDRFFIEQMAAKPITELILGITRDPQFGPALVLGAGGVLVELFKDSATLLFPIQRADVEVALASLKIAPLLNGYRGEAPADKSAIVDAVMGLAALTETHWGSIEEVDINPLFVYAGGVVSADAVVRLT